jgi:hypothetical protein
MYEDGIVLVYLIILPSWQHDDDQPYHSDYKLIFREGSTTVSTKMSLNNKTAAYWLFI